jgi:hypothetical protein
MASLVRLSLTCTTEFVTGSARRSLTASFNRPNSNDRIRAAVRVAGRSTLWRAQSVPHARLAHLHNRCCCRSQRTLPTKCQPGLRSTTFPISRSSSAFALFRSRCLRLREDERRSRAIHLCSRLSAAIMRSPKQGEQCSNMESLMTRVPVGG